MRSKWRAVLTSCLALALLLTLNGGLTAVAAEEPPAEPDAFMASMEAEMKTRLLDEFHEMAFPSERAAAEDADQEFMETLDASFEAEIRDQILQRFQEFAFGEGGAPAGGEITLSNPAYCSHPKYVTTSAYYIMVSPAQHAAIYNHTCTICNGTVSYRISTGCKPGACGSLMSLEPGTATE